MKSIFHICLGIAILLSSSADAQNYKVFEKYRHFLGDPKPTEGNGNDFIDLDEKVELEASKRRDDFIQGSGRKIAYDNHHRNQIATVDPNHPLLSPADTTLTTGLFHTCAITKRTGVDHETCGERACGPVKCWGHDESGQSSPPPGAMFTQISAGGYFTCGIRVEGDLVCWGEIDKALKSTNHLDEAAKKQTNSDEKHRRRLDKSEYKDEIMRRKSMAKEQHKHSLFSPNGAGKHIQVSSGMKHACAISRDLNVHCWGRNDFGESSPPSGKFVQVSAGSSFTCGLHPNGAVECWGKNNSGQSTPPNKLFQQISTSNVGDHACGILVENSTVHCWGDNARGQTESQEGPFLQVTPGMRSTCAIRDESDDTSIHCWGGRSHELLDHIQRDSSNANNDTLFHQVSLGKDHACAVFTTDNEALASSASLQCWWLAGSDFGAHEVPVGLEIAV